MSAVQGQTAPGFEAVTAAFADSLAEGQELGAQFALVRDGAVIVDLWAGYADRGRTIPYGPKTLTPLFSTTKAVAALMVARLIDQGRLAYDQPVAEVWPDFAQAGKGAVTVAQALSHQAGLSGFVEAMDPALWFDWDAICDKLAAMAPLWPPGTASGYHPVTYGYLAGEIFRRVDGRTLGTALREDLAQPLNLDIWIGLPEAEHGRCADLQRPPALPDFGEINLPTKAAFLEPWSSPGGRGQAEWRRAEIPSANGHATAQSLARLMGALATDGRLEGQMILSPAKIADMAREQIRGPDLVLPLEMSWGAGVMRNGPLKPWGPGEATFGHSGWGGSCVFADPDRGLAGAYVMNKQSAHLLGDPRPRRLIEAAYGCL